MGSVDSDPLQTTEEEDISFKFDIKSIAIIGAGPGGLAAAKYLSAYPDIFSKIVIFEQQASVGGVWNYTTSTTSCDIPQTTPWHPQSTLVKGSSEKGEPPVFSNPMYQDLHTNIPHTLMGFSDKSFDSEGLLFPKREEVKRRPGGRKHARRVEDYR